MSQTNMSHLALLSVCFLDVNREICNSYTQIRRCLLHNVKFKPCLGIYTGMLSCIVNLPEEVSVSLTKRVGENKTVLQLQKFADVLPTSSILKKIKKKN